MEVIVDNERFEGSGELLCDCLVKILFQVLVTVCIQLCRSIFLWLIGPSKKLAKTAAAKAVLAKIFNISYSPLNNRATSTQANSGDERITLPQILADHIGR